MSILKRLVLIIVTVWISYGQSTFTLRAPGPTGVSGVSTTRIGNQGNNNFFYWVVANYASGQGNDLRPSQARNAPNVLDGSNYIRVDWNFAPGAVSYDVLRTTTPSLTSPCTCALATGLTTFTYNNQNNTLSSYTYAPTGPATATISLNNTAYALPRMLMSRQMDMYLGPYTIAGSNPLPTPDPNQKYRFQVITDGSSSTDCTVGGGSGLVVCIDNGTSWVSAGTGGSGAGTVTNVTWTGGIVSIANSTTIPAFTIAGTSGGIPYFNSNTTWATSALLTANLPMIGGGAGTPPSVGTRSGNTTKFVSTTGSLVSGNCANWDANGNLIDAGAACGSGSGGSTPKHTIVTFSATPTFTVLANSDPMVFTQTLTGNVTSSTLDVTNAVDGQEIIFELCLDTTASRTFAPPSNVSGMGVIIAEASKCSRQNFYYNSNSGNTVAIAPMICPTCNPGGLGTSPGNIATASALAATPTLCSTGSAPTGILANGNATGCAITGGGSGTVTSMSFTGGLISVANPTTTPALTVAGTSGGLPYFNSSSTWVTSGTMASGQFILGGGAGGSPTTSFSVVPVANGGTGIASGTSGGILAYTASGTIASSAALTANLPVIGGGAGVAPSVGTRSGNTTAYVTTTGAQTNGDCVKIDANGNHIANGSACGSGSGISGLTTNTIPKAASSTTIANSSVTDDGTTVSTVENIVSGSGTTAGGSLAVGNSTGDTAASSVTINSGDGATNTEPGYLKIFNSDSTKHQANLFACNSTDGFFCIAAATPVANQTNFILTTDNTATLTNKSLSVGQLTGTLPVANGGTGLTAGTSGGVLAYTASGTLASSGALTANLPVIGGGAGVAPTVGTRSGNTTAYVTTTGTQTNGDCVKIDANGNHVANGSACGSGGSGTAGSPLFVQTASATVTSNTETTLIGSGVGSKTIPVNWFSAAGSVMEVCVSGIYTTAITPGTIRFRLKFGSTVISDTGAFTPAVSITNGAYAACTQLTARTVGASGTIMATNILPITAAVLALGGANFSNPTPGTAVTVDTTATQVIDFTVEFSLNATNSITQTNFYMVGPGSAVSSVFGQTGAVVNLSGDVTTAGSSVTTIANGAVTNVKVTSIDAATKLTGITPLANGGTGLSTAWARSMWSASAGCNNATAGTSWDLPTTNAPTPTCYGTSYRFGSLDYADSANQTATFSFVLPGGWTGSVDFAARAFVNATSQSVKLTVATVCVATSEDILNPTFNAAQTITVTSPGTANQQFEFAQSGLTTTGCAASELMIIKVGRDTTDTSTATFGVVGAGVSIRITPQA